MSKKLERLENTADNLGRSRVHVLQKYKIARSLLIRGASPQAKENVAGLYDYIFGKSDENPLEEVTGTYFKEMEILDNKLNKDILTVAI